MKILQFLLIIEILMFHGAVCQEFELSERVVQGRNCTPEESALLVSIAVDVYKNKCGGSIIAPKWVLTAAHCCDTFKKRGMKLHTVLAGQTVWLQDVDQTSHLEELFNPSSFSMSPLSSDVCLIKIKEPINPSTRVTFSRLATTKQFEEMIKKGQCNDALIVGHGLQNKRMSYEPVDPIYRPNANPHAQCINVKMVGRDGCHDHWNIGPQISETVFCAQNEVGGVCQGDSGGPIYCQGLQIGVASGAFGCADQRYPALFARVDLHLSFFEKVMALQERSGDNTSLDNASVSIPTTTTSKPIKSSSDTYFIGYYKILLCILLYVLLY